MSGLIIELTKRRKRLSYRWVTAALSTKRGVNRIGFKEKLHRLLAPQSIGDGFLIHLALLS